MSGIDKNKIENRLQRIANVLLLNASFTDNIGLLNGKMGIAIFFYQYARFTGNKVYEAYAGELIDEIYEEINNSTPVCFADGLMGIGWGIEYLVNHGFVAADTDEALIDIDAAVYRGSLYKPFLLEDRNDLFGYGLYYVTRLKQHENDEENLRTLFKKYHLIYLTDDCERILVQKKYLDYGITSLSFESLVSFSWFLLEMNRLKLFPVKVNKIISCLPELLKTCFSNINNNSELLLFRAIVNSMIFSITDTMTQGTLRDLLNTIEMESDRETTADLKVAGFVKAFGYHLIYSPYYSLNDYYSIRASEVVQIVCDEEKWVKKMDKLEENDLGLAGLAGLGLGLLLVP